MVSAVGSGGLACVRSLASVGIESRVPIDALTRSQPALGGETSPRHGGLTSARSLGFGGATHVRRARSNILPTVETSQPLARLLDHSFHRITAGLLFDQ